MESRTGEAAKKIFDTAGNLASGASTTAEHWYGLGKKALLGTQGLAGKARGMAGGAVGIADRVGATSANMVTNTLNTAGRIMENYPTIAGLLAAVGIYKVFKRLFSRRSDSKLLEAQTTANALMAQQLANHGMAEQLLPGQAAQMARYNAVQGMGISTDPASRGGKKFTDTVRGIITGNPGLPH